MRLLRIAAVLAAALLVVIGGCALLAYLNQGRIVAYVLNGVQRRSGIRIEPRSSHIELRSHLVVVLEHPRVFLPSGETITLSRIRAVLNYHLIIAGHGLPVYTLEFDQPAIRLSQKAGAAPAALAYPKPELVRKVVFDLGRLALATKQIDVIGLSLADAAGRPLLERVGMLAFRTRREPRLWNVSVDSTVAYPALAGARLAATFQVGAGRSMPEHVVLKGHLWFWQLPLSGLTPGSLKVSAAMHGSVGFSLRDDATLRGEAEIGVSDLTVTSAGLKSPLALGDYTLEAALATSPENIALTSATLRHGSEQVLAAQGGVQGQSTPNPKVHVQVGGIRIHWRDILSPLQSIREMPENLRIVMEYLKSASLSVAGASLKAPLDALFRLTPESLLKHLTVSAELSQASLTPPASTGLPPVSGIGAQLNYSAGVLMVTQGAAKMGNSTLSDLNARIDLSRGLARIPYDFSLRADVALGELKPTVMTMLERLKVKERGELEDISGTAGIEARGKGIFAANRSPVPASYEVRIRPAGTRLVLKRAPVPITLASGSVALLPGSIVMEKLSARAEGGSVELDGRLQMSPRGVTTRGIAVDVHQLPARQWVAMFEDPQTVAVQGMLGGHLVVARHRSTGLTLNGRLTLAPGTVKFGWLRSPIIVQAATLSFSGRSFVLAMPASQLEGAALDFTVSMADWRHPAIKINALAQKLDFGVMNFLRLPWEPPTKVVPFEFPASGHIYAVNARLNRLAMTNASGDFSYNHGDWRVTDFQANSLNGHIRMDLSGRAGDDWITMVGTVRHMDVGPLFLLSGKRREAPIVGHLNVDADMRADTDSDFFQTLTGTATIRLFNGHLNRFTLLSRLLSLINLKNWLTATMPNPLLAGLPFETITADFKGGDGVLHTDNLRLHGPVMDIVAQGNIDVAKSKMDMVVGMLPLKTVNWLISNIPIIGKNVAGATSPLIAAYFHVTGPVSDPSVVPAPITSVEELVKKTLGLPINILIPNTIR